MMSEFSDLKSFEKKFNTEEKCLKYLYKIRWKKGYRCPRCNCKEKWNVGEFKYKCKKCGYQTTVTAGTLFNRTHIPLKTWFCAIYYISTAKYHITVDGLQDFINLDRKRTVAKMLNMILWANIKPCSDKLSGDVYLDVVDLTGKKRMYLTLATDLSGKIKTSLNEKYSFERVNEFIERHIEFDSDIFYNPYILNGYLNDEKYKLSKIENCQNIARNRVLDLTRNKKKFPNMKFIPYLNCYKALYSAQNNNLSFNEILENAVNMSPIITDCSPLEYWLKYKRFPEIGYLKKAKKERLN